MQYTVSVTSKGQATIPAPIRKKLGIKPNDKVSYEMNEQNEVELKAVPDFFSLRGSLKSKIKYSDKKSDKAIGEYLGGVYEKSKPD